jgi:uncharacterized LabA/DUF88 family protein
MNVCIFIDGSNFYHNIKNKIGFTDIDFRKFIDKICKSLKFKTNFIRCYYYNSPVNKQIYPERARKQQKFFDALRLLPKFEVNLGRLEKRYNLCPKCGERITIECQNCNAHSEFTFIEKEVDVRIAVDMLSLARKNIYDVGVLVSDDGDFKPVFRELKELGKTPVFAGFSMTRVLMEESDIYIKLSKNFFKGLKI